MLVTYLFPVSTFVFVLASKSRPSKRCPTNILISLCTCVVCFINRDTTGKKMFRRRISRERDWTRVEYNRSINKSSRAAFTQYVNDKDKERSFSHCSFCTLKKVDIHLFLFRAYHYCVSTQWRERIRFWTAPIIDRKGNSIWGGGGSVLV